MLPLSETAKVVVFGANFFIGTLGAFLEHPCNCLDDTFEKAFHGLPR